jgi:3-methyladenine DNA glycosylase AlkD
MGLLDDFKKELAKHINKEKAAFLPRFFKTGKGEYGEGDEFIGVVVPDQRIVSKKYYDKLSLDELQTLLNSKVHEYRLTALLILVLNYNKSNKNEVKKKEIFDFYLSNTKNINNWDLVDMSSPNIVGDYLLDKDRTILYKLAKSKNLWEKRISIMSTLTFIRHKEYNDALKIAEILLHDEHDLIHKAVGWMIREVGNRDKKSELKFLDEHYKTMPRTMLRYAIEKFSNKERMHYLSK